MPSVFIKTYGCQMNERDSEAVTAQLVARGYVLASSEAAADVILINTCSVRDQAEKRALGRMENLLVETRRRPGVVLGFMGCMAQSRGSGLFEKFPDIDLVVGTQKAHHIADYVDDLLAGRRAHVVDTNDEAGSQNRIREHLSPDAGANPVSAFVSIMQGCNQHCTFCIVPQTRGEERSRPVADIVSECRAVVAGGVREITLLGQIVTSYGRREIPAREGRSAFVQLLNAVHEIDGLERLRFTSPHPKGYGDDLVEAYGRLPKLVESAHIPVQSGSNRVLKLMHRGYTRERFLELTCKLRRVQPGMGLCTDIIVGFPGETEADFEETMSLVREADFDQAYLFKYSPRKDTPAATLPYPVPAAVREERHQRLLALVNEIAARRYNACVGRTMQVLVEGTSRRNAARMSGRTRCNKILVFDGDASSRGQLLDLRVSRVGSFTLYGEPGRLPA
jgi:tRNA-2-methylthio-N6-dimethylallyladenosine synthase